MSLQDYISKLQKISSNAKDVSPFTPALERKAVELAGEDVAAIGTFTSVNLNATPSTIKRLKQHLPELQQNLFKQVTGVEKSE